MVTVVFGDEVRQVTMMKMFCFIVAGAHPGCIAT
jgi:hypothetical protein